MITGGCAAGIVLFETGKQDRHRYRLLVYAALVPAAFAHGLNNYIVTMFNRMGFALDAVLFTGFILMYRYIGKHTPYGAGEKTVPKVPSSTGGSGTRPAGGGRLPLFGVLAGGPIGSSAENSRPVSHLSILR
jgi:hypothetical protein